MKGIKGGCLCKAIRYTLSAEADFPHFCSCRRCQLWSGSPVVAWVDFPVSALTWDGSGGEPSYYRVSETSKRGFCGICGSAICAVDDGSEAISLTIATLDNPNDFVPESHSYKDKAPSWLVVRSQEGPAVEE